MQRTHRAAAEWELVSLITEFARTSTAVEIIGGGSKRDVGHPIAPPEVVSTGALRGITLYEPTELVMSAAAGTPLAEIETVIAERGQMLAFEPIDLGPVLGVAQQKGTIGGVFATNLSGSRRIFAGSARDQLIGLRAITGRGEVFRSGGRVMKNVTGYDLARGLTGSWGTLAVFTEVTFKVSPRPEGSATLLLFGLADDVAAEVLCAAMGTPFEVSGAVHLQAHTAARLRNEALQSLGRSVTAARIEGFSRFLPARVNKLKTVLASFADVHVLPDTPSRALWSELRELSVFQRSEAPLWRISVAPLQGPRVVESIARHMPVEALYDWSGGLVWLQVADAADAGESDIRRVISRTSGHATLIRAKPSVRGQVDVFQPLDAQLQRISRQLKASFDPAGILNPGRISSTY